MLDHRSDHGLFRSVRRSVDDTTASAGYEEVMKGEHFHGYKFMFCVDGKQLSA
jgi:hypothetical protein